MYVYRRMGVACIKSIRSHSACFSLIAARVQHGRQFCMRSDRSSYGGESNLTLIVARRLSSCRVLLPRGSNWDPTDVDTLLSDRRCCAMSFIRRCCVSRLSIPVEARGRAPWPVAMVAQGLVKRTKAKHLTPVYYHLCMVAERSV